MAAYCKKLRKREKSDKKFQRKNMNTVDIRLSYFENKYEVDNRDDNIPISRIKINYK